jgi:hypothetical protein
MIVLDLFLGISILYYTFIKRKLNRDLIIYNLLGVCCSLVVVLSPGNSIRDLSLTHTNKHNVAFTLLSSLKTAYEQILEWFYSPQILLVSCIIIFSFLFFKNKSSNRIHFGYFIVALVAGYLIIFASFTTGYWSTGYVAPTRTVNVSYWLFICYWVVLLSLLLNVLMPIIIKIKKGPYEAFFFILILILPFSTNSSGNHRMAVTDLMTGKAYFYNREHTEREKILQTSSEKICSLPTFTFYPLSIYNEDITADENNWWNKMIAHYYNKEGVRVVYKEPCFSKKFYFNLESPNNEILGNQNTITNELAFSPPNSSVLNGKESCSVLFKKRIKELGFSNETEITSANITSQLYSTDSLINSVLIFCVTDPQNVKNLQWTGKEIISENFPKNKWVKIESFVLINKEFLKPDNNIVVYIWNRSLSKLYIDDLDITIY